MERHGMGYWKDVIERLGDGNPRQHVAGIFTDKAAMKVFRTQARAALSA